MNTETNAQSNDLTRREFIKTALVAGTGFMVGAGPFVNTLARSFSKKRYAIVGVGSRSKMYQGALQEEFGSDGELAAACDVNAGRLKLAQDWHLETTGRTLPVYAATDFDRMIAETKPDTIIVTTVDGFHHQYIVRALELNCDVITEKPMTIDAVKCQQIIDTQHRTGRQCRVTFNYRYSPPRTQIKDLLMSGVIGEVLSVDFHWLLNTFHGADYFRRWHSYKKYSGGLMIHKATHHFDLINWWLSAVPVSVFATGKREFYTPAMAKRFGLTSSHARCHTCPEAQKCGFYFSLKDHPDLKTLYLDQEHHDGYYRDQCVFRPEIDIEDTMNVLVKYDNQVTLCYSVNAFNAWEGYVVAFNGTKGRLEHQAEESIYVSGTNTVQGGIKSGSITTRVMPLRGPIQEMEPWSSEGSHGGGDAVLLADLFSPTPKADPYLRAADQRSGAYSILIGAAANISMAHDEAVEIAKLAPDVGRPDYPAMPSRTDALPMP